MNPDNRSLALAIELRETLAGTALTPPFAKLYSQHTRLRTGQPGLGSWRDDEASVRLSDALRILEAAFIEREAGKASWRNGVRRAGELLEWLSHPELNPDRLPIRLFAAAAYQLAGYPARAVGLLNDESQEPLQSNESGILKFLLKAEFPNLLRQLTDFWAAKGDTIRDGKAVLPWDSDILPSELYEWIVEETMRALGILCIEMRWGNESRVQKALDKLSTIAKTLLHGDDGYSWLLAKITGEVATIYTQSSLRHYLQELSKRISPSGQEAFERYVRQSYQSNRILAWPSQVRGIERLGTDTSFALCTPTGSGKTTVAEIAILQSLFPVEQTTNQQNIQNSSLPLAIYLVPSKALAAEVEAKLSKVLRRIDDPVIIVTALYGGTDWGPTDAWVTANDRIVLICTYEKAEAFMRILGPAFLNRVSLIVIDEAHYVQFDTNVSVSPEIENRSLRLESLGTRLLTYLDRSKSRVIALSAVAAGVEDTLAQWVTGRPDAISEKTFYRSTRQLVGRLEFRGDGSFEIRYDLLDGSSLRFADEAQSGTPYIYNPFPSCPPVPKRWNTGPEKRLRPYLFWAAMHLAAPDAKGEQHTVLISVTQNPGGYADDFLQLLDSVWTDEQKPRIFIMPTDPERLKIWKRCLESCADYFSTDSREYQLLARGIVLHHGRMPGSLARLLTEVIQERIAYLVVATSTLSEGVNLPIETVLISNLLRSGKELTVREFSNLIGRAGRPGVSTEGRTLVLLEAQPIDESSMLARRRYGRLVRGLQIQGAEESEDVPSKSSLAELLVYLEKQWQRLSGVNSRTLFFNWLEETTPTIVEGLQNKDESERAFDALDSLDRILLSAIVELEEIAARELGDSELEEELRRVWRNTYARYASQRETELSEIFIRRGRALKTLIYPDAGERMQLYRTSLTPLTGRELLYQYSRIREFLESGVDYAIWDRTQRFDYVRAVVDQIRRVSKFSIPEFWGSGRNRVSWEQILQWWLDHQSQVARQPSRNQVANWHDYVSKNFGYTFNWGLGSVTALAMNDAYGGTFRLPTLESWPETGLPWIVYWLKELIIWGTLEPVAAYLLARRTEVTRPNAEKAAQMYYADQSPITTANELLNASAIKKWVEGISQVSDTIQRSSPPKQLKVKLLRDFSHDQDKLWRVIPIEIDKQIRWFDPAGFPLAMCERPTDWRDQYLDTHDFTLNPGQQIISSSHYV